MKTATVEELHNPQSKVMRWVEAGEAVAIYRDNVVVARLLPAPPAPPAGPASGKTLWERSAVSRRDKSEMTHLTAAETAAIINEFRGNW